MYVNIAGCALNYPLEVCKQCVRQKNMDHRGIYPTVVGGICQSLVRIQPEAPNTEKAPRAKTVDEVREEFLTQLRVFAKYWAEAEDVTNQERCDGLVFSILNIFDGNCAEGPSLDIVVNSPAELQVEAAEEGENWYLHGQVLTETSLHEFYFKE
jgi:hypothetical protein